MQGSDEVIGDVPRNRRRRKVFVRESDALQRIREQRQVCIQGIIQQIRELPCPHTESVQTVNQFFLVSCGCGVGARQIHLGAPNVTPFLAGDPSIHTGRKDGRAVAGQQLE